MKTTVVTLIQFMALGACRNNHSTEISCAETDAQQFPISIEGGTKLVYQVGQMTPRGLKFHLDTIDAQGSILVLPNSVKSAF
jgi:hypothetical protein